ncbi:hypothetical protein [Fluviicola taffensis]|uniref:hypothetical protein n=1 Tax=Fluviicola taffensis TaxID=191579 RepID=UPI003137CAF0
MRLKFSLISIFVNILIIIGIIYHNYQLASLYQETQGKERALFAIIELAQLDKKLYLGYCIVFTLILGIVAWRKKEPKKHYLFAIGLSILSISLLFIRLWVYGFIWWNFKLEKE